MGAQIEAAALAAADGVEEGVVVMAAVHPVERSVMDALQAQLQADVALPRVLLQQIQHRIVYGIGPRADGEADDLRVVQGLVVESAQACDRRVRVSGRLKISEEAIGTIPATQEFDAALHLIADGRPRQPAVGAEAAVVAVDAAAGRDGPVHVGAGEAGVDGDAKDAAAEALAQEAAEGAVTPAGTEFGGNDCIERHDRSFRRASQECNFAAKFPFTQAFGVL